jgi:hypothetical protein
MAKPAKVLTRLPIPTLIGPHTEPFRSFTKRKEKKKQQRTQQTHSNNKNKQKEERTQEYHLCCTF